MEPTNVIRGNGEPLPLVGMLIDANIKGNSAEVVLKETFENPTNGTPLEITMTFWAGLTSAVYYFDVLTSDGKKIIAKINKKQKAAETYDDSVSSGHSAYLLECKKDLFFGEVIQLSIGSLQPEKWCTITLKYVIQLDFDPLDGSSKLAFPYTRNVRIAEKEPQSCHPDNFIIGSHINVQIHSLLDPITDITTSLTSKDSLQITKTEDNKKAVIQTTLEQSSGNRFNEFNAFWIKFLTLDSNFNVPKTLVEKDKDDHCAVMIQFFPKIDPNETPLDEVILLLDRSGSMSGSKIQQAKDSIQVLLRSLPIGCLFNIISFGSQFSSMFQKSIEYNQQSMEKASNSVNLMTADMGGTELLQPLQSILSAPPDPNFPRVVIILTDGDVSNARKCTEFVKNHSDSTRVFTIGIGSDVSQELITDIAKAGNGVASFIKSSQGIQHTVMSQLRNALVPNIKHLTIDWGNLQIEQQIPKTLPSLFSGDSLMAFAFVIPTSETHEITLLSKDHSWKATIDLKNAVKGETVHRLAVRAKANEIGKSPTTQENQELLSLALKYSIATKLTSFIAVDQTNGTTTEEALKLVEINATPHSIPQPMSISQRQAATMMNQNIDSLLARSEQLETLTAHSEDLSRQSRTFLASAKKSNPGILTSIIGSIVGFFSFSSSSSSSNAPTTSAMSHYSNTPPEPNFSMYEVQNMDSSKAKISLPNDSFRESYGCTIGAAFQTSTISVGGVKTKLEMWSTNGQERYRSLAPMYYRGAKAAVVMFDLAAPETFEMAKRWIEELQIQASPDVFIALVGNKLDLPRKVKAEDAKILIKDISHTGGNSKKVVFLGESRVGKRELQHLLAGSTVEIPTSTKQINKEKQPKQEPIIPKISTETSTTTTTTNSVQIQQPQQQQQQPIQSTTNNDKVSNTSQIAFNKIVLLQRADGSWIMNEQFQKTIKFDTFLTNKVQFDNKPNDIDCDENQWATAIALACLEKVFGDRKDEWVFIAQKAKKWLGNEKTMKLLPKALEMFN